MLRLAPTHRPTFLALVTSLSLISACASDAGEGRTTRTITLDDRDLDGLLENIDPNAPDGPILPEPEYCPVVEWREIYDAAGNLIEVCTQCIDDSGAPIGEAACGGVPEPIVCEQLPSPPEQSCWRCTDAAGVVIDEGCVELPSPCESDADCGENEQCYQYYVCGDEDGDGSVGSDGNAGDTDPNAPTEPTEPWPGETFGVCGPKTITCTTDADCAAGEICVIPEAVGGEDGDGRGDDEGGDETPDQLPPEFTGICARDAGPAPAL